MTTAEQLEELAERVEKLTHADMDVGREILLACGWRKTCFGNFHGPIYQWSSPDAKIGFDDDKFHERNPLASLDAAMTLVPDSETWDLTRLRTPTSPMRSFGHGKMFRAEVGSQASVSDFPTIALTAAALRARAQLARKP